MTPGGIPRNSTLKMEDPLQRINAAIIDGRCRTPRYIQKQLKTLHSALVQESSNLHQAIVKDTGCSSAEAWLEIHMTVQAVRELYEAIDFKDCLQKEYSIAHTGNAISIEGSLMELPTLFHASLIGSIHTFNRQPLQ